MALFRPEENARRFNASARRLAMPELPEELFVEAVRQLVLADRDWFPPVEGGSLYLRPFMFASEAFLGVRPAKQYKFLVICQPGRQLLQVGRAGGVDLGLARTTPAPRPAAPARPSAAATTPPASCRRPRRSRTGHDQVVFLDAAEHNWVEELGGMNLFFVFDDGTLVTPPLTGTILPGITRDSLLDAGARGRADGARGALQHRPVARRRRRAAGWSNASPAAPPRWSPRSAASPGDDGEFTIGSGGPGQLTTRAARAAGRDPARQRRGHARLGHADRLGPLRQDRGAALREAISSAGRAAAEQEALALGAALGLEIYPCTSSRSIPSAVTVMPRLWPRPMIAR